MTIGSNQPHSSISTWMLGTRKKMRLMSCSPSAVAVICTPFLRRTDQRFPLRLDLRQGREGRGLAWLCA